MRLRKRGGMTNVPQEHASQGLLRILGVGFGIAVAIGAIIGSVVVIGRRSLLDIPTIANFVATLLGLIYIKKVPELTWILAAGTVGLFLS